MAENERPPLSPEIRAMLDHGITGERSQNFRVVVADRASSRTTGRQQIEITFFRDETVMRAWQADVQNDGRSYRARPSEQRMAIVAETAVRLDVILAIEVARLILDRVAGMVPAADLAKYGIEPIKGPGQT